MRILALFNAETERWAIFAMASLAGAANVFLLALVNNAAEHVVVGELDLQLLGLYLCGFGILATAQHYSMTRTAQAVDTVVQRMRQRIADKVRRADLRLVERLGGISAYAALYQDATVVSQGAQLVVFAARSLLILVSAALYLLLLSPLSVAAMLAIYATLAPVYVLSLRRTRQGFLDAEESDRRVFARFTGILAGFKELKLNRPENDALFGSIAETAEEGYRLKRATAARQMRGMVLRRTINYVALFAVVFLVPLLSSESPDRILKVAATVLLILGPLTVVIDGLPILVRVDAAVGNLESLEARLDAAGLHADEHSPPAPLSGFKRITLDGVGFHYRDKDGQCLFGVGPLDLTLHAGETLFIVGGNGSGKSTLLKLMTGLYSPDEGRILLDGQDVPPAERARYRTLFTSVFRDFHVFERLYGLPDIDPEIVNAKLAELGLADKTRYGEAGFSNLDLSAGQKKRLAFAAAMLKERPVLVLDELAADQDAQFRRRYYEEILPRLKAAGHTLLVVSHDEQHFHTADRVLQMRDGQILAQVGGSVPQAV